MACGCGEFAVNRQEKGEAEEGDDDQVDEANGRRGRRAGRVKGPQVVGAEADARTQGLRRMGEAAARDGVVAQDLLRPHLAEFGLDVRLQLRENGHDVVVVRVLVARLHVDGLAGAQGVVRGVARLHRGAQQRRRVGVDDDGGPGLLREDGVAHLQRVVGEIGRRDGDVAEVHGRVGRDLGFGEFGD